jgi:hypothetical protein
MTVNLYQYSDSGAPSLTGEAGSLITVLDAILVDGYGAKSGAGWTKAYSGTNKAAYKMGGGNERYIRFVDDGTGSATYARCVGYESMSDVDTGSGAFPTSTQFSGGLYWYKSSTANNTVRQWVAVATDSFLFMYVNVDNGSGSNAAAFCFGDIFSYLSSDEYNTILIGTSSSTVTSNGSMHLVQSTITSTLTGHYLARSYTQLGTSIQANKHSDPVKGCSSQMGDGKLPYPHPVDGGVYMSPVFVCEPSSSVVRGVLPGVWDPLHNEPFSNYDTFQGIGDLAGKEFMALKVSNYQFLIETSDTWGT